MKLSRLRWSRLCRHGVILLAAALMAMAARPSFVGSQLVVETSSVDTVYLRDTMYLEVNRARQLLVQHFASGRADTHGCSTGNPRRRRSIATPLGVFRINSKAKRHVSTIFHVAMLHWMPFNHGVGIHALNDTSYYRNLGVAPSSAGCVRVSKRSAVQLYESCPVGTTVYVHGGLADVVFVYPCR